MKSRPSRPTIRRSKVVLKGQEVISKIEASRTTRDRGRQCCGARRGWGAGDGSPHPHPLRSRIGQPETNLASHPRLGRNAAPDSSGRARQGHRDDSSPATWSTPRRRFAWDCSTRSCRPVRCWPRQGARQEDRRQEQMDRRGDARGDHRRLKVPLKADWTLRRTVCRPHGQQRLEGGYRGVPAEAPGEVYG